MAMFTRTQTSPTEAALLAKIEELEDKVGDLHRLLYNAVHDDDDSLPISGAQTEAAFRHQWETYKSGKFLLSDPWFVDNLQRIICEEEMLLKPEWFEGKEVLDAGCGNGRWSYGLASLGANVTAVDVNESAIAETRAALEPFDVRKEFVVSPLEDVHRALEGRQFDLVLSWGVLHHCTSFSRSLQNVCSLVRPGGALFLYLYGRQSVSYQNDVQLFSERLHYNLIDDEEQKYLWLLDKARGDVELVHNLHDVYAPLVNRRYEFDDVRDRVESLGFGHVLRTIDHTEVWLRAVKGEVDTLRDWSLEPATAPYWFQHQH